MGVGLYLIGKLHQRGVDPLAAIEQFLRAHRGDDVLDAWRSDKALHVRLHPAADDVGITLPQGPEGDEIRVSATTSTVGPGYHADLCELIEGFGKELGVAWEPPDEDEGTGDETSYFVTRDLARLESEMLRWLATVVKVLTEDIEDDSMQLQLSMPMEPHYRGPEGAALLTVLGPRDRAWLDAVRADPRAGIDIFAWWSPGRGAAYELYRALVHLWLDVRFHPAQTDDEERLGRDLLRRLGRAYRLNPSLDYPWAAWSLLHDHVVDAEDDDLSELIRQRAERAGPNTIGYRHHDLEVRLPGGWSVTVPGSFSQQIDGGTWSFWGDNHSISATVFEPAGDSVSADDMLASRSIKGIEVRIDGLATPHRAWESSFIEDGERFFSLIGEIAVDGSLLALTANVPEESLLVWARRVLASVRPP